MKFFNLHQHTTYSFLDGYGQPKQYVERLKELGSDGMALTEHGNIYSHIPFTGPFKKAGLHLVYGCEFYIVNDPFKKEERLYYHITVLAKTTEGYLNLLKLVNLGNKLEQFYYKPRIGMEQLLAYSKGLIVLSGCFCDGYLIKMKEKGKDPSQKRVDAMFDVWCTKFKNVEWYLEMQPYTDMQDKWDRLAHLAKKHSIPALVTADAHYPHPDHKTVQNFQLLINTNRKMGDPDALQMDFPLHLPTAEEMLARCKEMGEYDSEWVTGTNEVGLSCQVDLPHTKMIVLNTKITTIRRWCMKRMKLLGLDKKPEYKARLKYELELIAEKKYEDYFAIIHDVCKWAKKRMLVGAGRGSSAGSLVCYLLYITEVDPLRFNLLFERFIDLNRTDLPDIDLDFPSSRREEVIQYLTKKYGKDKTAQLITFSTFKPKAIVQDASRTVGIPPWEAKEATSQLIERSGGDSRAESCLSDSIEQFEKLNIFFNKHPEIKDAIQLEGQVKQIGKHAAAIVIGDDPLDEIGVIDRSGVFSIDKYHIEEYGLLKIDVLGIETLGIIQDVCEEVGFDYNELYTMDLEDPKVYKEVFQARKLLGIFQFEGLALRSVNKAIKPSCFEHLVNVTALSRPGPLNSGSTEEYTKRFNGKPFDIDPVLEPYTKNTLGIIIFQEQVMNVVRNIGKFSWKDTSSIRKAMSKNLGEEFFNNFINQFIKGAGEQGIEEAVARSIWNRVYTFGAWAFNLSHSVSYALLSYWCAYIKTYYPAQFYARILRGEGDEDKLRSVLREWGGKFIGLDINKSNLDWTVSEDNELVGGFTSIKGLGPSKAEKVIAAQPFESIEDMQTRLPKGIAKTLTTVIEEGLVWTNLNAIAEAGVEGMKKVSLTSNPVDLGELVDDDKVSEKVEYIVIAKVLSVKTRSVNQEDKVIKRGGKIMSGPEEYVIVRIRDDASHAILILNRFFVDKNRQTVLSLKDKICLFKVTRLESGLLNGKKLKVLT